jgi:hypothetical protein
MRERKPHYCSNAWREATLFLSPKVAKPISWDLKFFEYPLTVPFHQGPFLVRNR